MHDLTVFGRDVVVGDVLNERMTPVICPSLYRASDIGDPSDLAKLPAAGLEIISPAQLMLARNSDL
ncbi:hypothetical protein C6558_32410 [Ensifer sp. NM-2]|nr:hypothetical protein C6558_32410 [Ensifer sp. NM-2]